MFWTYVFLIVLNSSVFIDAHGRFVDPPSRSSMWRYGFDTPINYSDNQLFCGGVPRQYDLNGGKCGLCGDPYDGPLENQAGGLYATGTIGKTYQENDVMPVAVEITANHKGYFQFRLCVNNDVTKSITQECLDKYPLKDVDSGNTTIYLGSTHNGMYEYRLQLPVGVSCTQCVVQWRYHTGNSWGTDPDGTSCLGCGNQEEFYGCSDIAVEPSQAPQTSAPTTPSTKAPTQAPTQAPVTDLITPGSRCELSCVSLEYVPSYWCDIHCNQSPSLCPLRYCNCRITS